jgi:hypothetical protein
MMATDLSIGEHVSNSRLGSFCNYAQHCLWYETSAPTSQVCANRDTLACQKRCEEVFGQRDKLADHQTVG